MMPFMAKNGLLCYLIDTSKFGHLKEMKEIIIDFAGKIDIINMNNIPMEHTIKLMKTETGFSRKLLILLKMRIFIWIIMNMWIQIRLN